MLKRIIAMLLLLTTLVGLTACGGEGPKGDKGDPGEQGPKGDPGESITLVSLVKTSSDGLIDEWTMSFSNGETMKFNVTNGKDGTNGLTPAIGTNGNWWIGETDTGIKAQGPAGAQGATGKDGDDGDDGVTPHIGTNGNWYIGDSDTGVAAGAVGKDGTTPHIGTNGNWYLGETDTGVKAQGQAGKDGITPHIGTNGNWYIGDSDTGVFAGGGTSGGTGTVAPVNAKMTSIVLDRDLADAKSFKINFSDSTSIPFTVATGETDKSAVVLGYESALAKGYSKGLDAWIIEHASLAYDTLVIEGSPLDAKSLGVAMPKILNEYDKYFSFSADELKTQTAPLDTRGKITVWTAPHQISIVEDGNLIVTSEFVPAAPGNVVHLTNQWGVQSNIVYCGWYDAEGNIIGSFYNGQSTSKSIVLPEGTEKIRVAFWPSSGNTYTAEVWDNDIKLVTKSALNPTDINNMINGTTGGGSAELPKTIVNAVLGSVSILTTKPTVAAGEWLYLTDKENTVHHNKTITFRANIDGVLESGESILVGHGYEEISAYYLELTSTQIIINYQGYSGVEQKVKFDHGLTVSDYVAIAIDGEEDAGARISVTTSSGTYQASTNWWVGRRGKIFAYSEQLEMTNVSLRFLCDAYSEKIWLYGDSYFDTTYGGRWPYYLVKDGHTDYLLSGYAGMITSAALEQFKIDVTYGTPQYAVWCMGMNNGDSATAINSSWLECTEEFLRICEAEGITPILATIPSTEGGTTGKGKFNYLKSEWVRESGYRYIDFAIAVGGDRQFDELVTEQNPAGALWFDGMLHSDGIHPADKGAYALYVQVITDFPEILKKN